MKEKEQGGEIVRKSNQQGPGDQLDKDCGAGKPPGF